jgi:uncharacterized protein (DUF433 family)
MMTVEPSQFWKSRLTTPAYRIGEAASYTQVSPQTVAAWHRVRPDGRKALLKEKDKQLGLSFLQLIELAVVAEMRRAGLKVAQISRARDWFKHSTGLEYPFAQLRFKTDGAEILQDDDAPFHEGQIEKLISANNGGQYVWRDLLSKRLKEFNYDDETGAVSVWKVAGTDKSVLIDPKIAFGAPQIRGVKTAVLKAHWLSGEEVADLADDFDLTPQEIVDALMFEGVQGENPRLSKWIN